VISGERSLDNEIASILGHRPDLIAAADEYETQPTTATPVPLKGIHIHNLVLCSPGYYCKLLAVQRRTLRYPDSVPDMAVQQGFPERRVWEARS
jgi:hypothetical protein